MRSLCCRDGHPFRTRPDVCSQSALSLRLFGEDITPHKPAPKARDVAKLAQEDAARTSTEGEGEGTPVAGGEEVVVVDEAEGALTEAVAE